MDLTVVDRRHFLGGATALVGSLAITRTVSAALLQKSSVAIDHISLGVQNLYEGVDRLRRETGLGNYDGGWFPDTGVANKYVPLGGGTYVEVESVVDTFAVGRGYPLAIWGHDQLRDGDAFWGWSCRVSSREEIEAIAKRLGTEVIEKAFKVGMNGHSGSSDMTPNTFEAWKRGMPNFFYRENLENIPSPGAVTPSPLNVRPAGLAWLEVGGAEQAMSTYLGVPAASLGLRCNGKTPGVHALGVHTEHGEVEIRRRPISIG